MDNVAIFDYAAQNTSVSQVALTGEDPALDSQRRVVDALENFCRERGLRRAAKQSADEIERLEDEMRAAAPAGYRKDELSVNGRGDCYRRETYLGRKVMGVEDFLAYFEMCHTSRPLHCYDVEGAEPIKQPEAPETAGRTRKESRALCDAVRNQTSLPERIDRRVKQGKVTAQEWLQFDRPTVQERKANRRIPISLLSALIVIAVSLMLIVSSAVMVAGMRREVGGLEKEVRALEKQSALMGDKLEATIDYREVYRLATEEYGMLEADYVSASYNVEENARRIEAFEPEEPTTFGLSTLLSALGFRK